MLVNCMYIYTNVLVYVYVLGQKQINVCLEFPLALLKYPPPPPDNFLLAKNKNFLYGEFFLYFTSFYLVKLQV